MSFDTLAIGGVNRAYAVHEFASGKAVNAARVLHALGMPAMAVGFVGGDRGQRIRKGLETSGIPHDFLDVAPRTRLCVTINDRNRRESTELVEEAAPVDEGDYARLLEKLAEHLPSAKVLLLAGSMPPNAPNDFYADCCRLATAHDARVILDARGEALKRALAAGPLVVKPNRDELAETLGQAVGSQRHAMDAMRQLQQGGAGWVVVTRGPGGAMMTDGERFWDVPAPRVEAVSAVGSGDAFAAGLAFELASDRPVDVETMVRAMAFATACGTANAVTPFAGHIDLATLRRVQHETHVRLI